MNRAELVFLRRKLEEDKPKFYRTLRTLGIAFVTIPLVGGIMSELNKYFNRDKSREFQQQLEYDNPLGGYIISFVVFVLIIVLAAWIAYQRSIGNVIKDLRHKTKIVELTTIRRKLHMTQNNTYHFYLSSPTKLSIEISAAEYELYREGDEINIEYGAYTKIFFGYF